MDLRSGKAKDLERPAQTEEVRLFVVVFLVESRHNPRFKQPPRSLHLAESWTTCLQPRKNPASDAWARTIKVTMMPEISPPMMRFLGGIRPAKPSYTTYLCLDSARESVKKTT